MTKFPEIVKADPTRVVGQFGISGSHLEGVIPKVGVLQPAEGYCVGYPGFTAREIPHYA